MTTATQRIDRPAPTEAGQTDWRPAVAATLVYFGLSLLYFLPAFLPFRQIFGTDYLAGGYFFQEFISERLAAGSLPKWVPYVYGGLPLFANPGSAFFPVRLIADLLLPVRHILPAIFVVQFGLAGLGMMLFARELGCRSWIAFVTGLAYQFSGLAMSYVLAGHDGRIIVATLAPMFFFFLYRGIRTGGLGAFVGVAATLGFALLSFQIQSAYYLLLAGAAWAAFALIRHGVVRTPRQLLVRGGLAIAAVAFGFALAAVNFLPFLDYIDQSPRGGEGGRGYEYSTSWSMPPAEITGLAVPEHAGILENYRGDSPFKLHTEYVGALVVVLLALGFAYARRDRTWWFFVGLALFMLSISFGGYTPLYRLYYAVLPATEKFRTPNIAFFVVVFSLVSMAALTFERLARVKQAALAGGRGGRAGGHGASTSPARDPLAPAAWILAALVAASLVTLAVVSGTGGGEPRDAAFVRGVGRFTIFLLLTAGALWLWVRGHIAPRVALAALALVTVADLWVVDRRFFETTAGPAEAFAADDVARFLSSQPQPARTWVLPVPAGAVYRGRVDDYLMHFDLAQAGGEHGNQLQRYNEYVGAGEQTYVDWHNFLQEPAFLRAANVRYIVSGVPLDLPFLREVHRGSALVYENVEALPRAYLVSDVRVADEPDETIELMRSASFDPARVAVLEDPLGEPLTAAPLDGAAEIVAYEPDRVIVETRANRRALLVLADNYYEGWTATIDGDAAPVLRANHTFRAVVVGPGEQRVVFEFRPRQLYLGFAIYLAGFTLLTAYLLYLLVRRTRRPGAAGA